MTQLEFKQLILEAKYFTKYEAILHKESLEIYGYEALSKFDIKNEIISTEEIFKKLHHKNFVVKSENKIFSFCIFYLYICQSTLHALSDVRRRTLKIMIALNSKLSNCSHLSSCIIYSFSYSYISLYKNHNNYYTKKFNSNVEKYCLLFFASICK